MKSALKIRKAKPDDVLNITRLILRCSDQYILADLSQQGVATYLESHSLENMKERLKTFDYRVLVDEKSDILGVVGLRKPSHLFHLHVAPELHKQGYGRKLWDLVRKAALKDARIESFTVNSSRYAVPFYQKLGFVPGAELEKDGMFYIPMKLTLAN